MVEVIEAGGEGISRRALLTGAGGVAGAALVTAAATPLASLGPTLGGCTRRRGREGSGWSTTRARPYRADEIQIGSFYTALPERSDPEAFGAGLLVVRLPPEYIHLPAARRDWAPGGNPRLLEDLPARRLRDLALPLPDVRRRPASVPAFTCPCHYSTFLPGEGGRLMFGPAGRALPQLPLMVDARRAPARGGTVPRGHRSVVVGNVHRAQS